MTELVVVSAGVSTPSSTSLLAGQIKDATLHELSRQGVASDDVAVTTIELRELAKDLATLMTSGIPSSALSEAKEKLAQADGLIAVTPTFAASYSGLFKMFFDSIDPLSIEGVPTAMAATAGTSRHQLTLDYAMRPLFSYLKAQIMPTSVFAATDDFGKDTSLSSRISKAGAELASAIVGAQRRVGNDEYNAMLEDTDEGKWDEEDISSPAPRKNIRESGVNISGEGLDFSRMLQGHTGD